MYRLRFDVSASEALSRDELVPLSNHGANDDDDDSGDEGEHVRVHNFVDLLRMLMGRGANAHEDAAAAPDASSDDATTDASSDESGSDDARDEEIEE